MKARFTLLLLSSIPVVGLAQEDAARKNELAFGLGGIPALSRSDAPSLDAGSGVLAREEVKQPAGDRIRIAMSGKFLPYEEY